MKKYIAAAAVAVMVFAFAAFAASLTVNAETLQAGETESGDLSCVDEVSVTAWGYNDYTGKVTFARVTADGNDCGSEENLYMTLLNNEGERLLEGGHDGEAVVVSDFGSKGDDEFVIDLTGGDQSADAGVDAAAIGGVRMGVDSY